MEISVQMINYYLSYFTEVWFNDNDLPPDDVREYHPFVKEMELAARKHDDVDALKEGIQYILGNPHFDIEQFSGSRYPFDRDELIEIVEYLWRVLWPNEGPIPRGGPTNIELVQMPLEVWWSRKRTSAGG